jgi:hypothetical protein
MLEDRGKCTPTLHTVLRRGVPEPVELVGYEAVAELRNVTAAVDNRVQQMRIVPAPSGHRHGEPVNGESRPSRTDNLGDLLCEERRGTPQDLNLPFEHLRQAAQRYQGRLVHRQRPSTRPPSMFPCFTQCCTVFSEVSKSLATSTHHAGTPARNASA